MIQTQLERWLSDARVLGIKVQRVSMSRNDLDELITSVVSAGGPLDLAQHLRRPGATITYRGIEIEELP